MATRRGFLAGLMASGLTPRLGWADAGAPAFLSAGRTAAGRDFLFGLDRTGNPIFRIAIPARGHAAAAHPDRPEAVAFARRPGRFAVVLDCVAGTELARLDAPEGRHFYGHGAFSGDGALLFTTENDYENGVGCLGIWDVAAGYRRTGEITSGGIGSHDMRLMPDGQTLVVANGGIETHPDSGRVKLNLPTMQPRLSYVSFDGKVVEQAELPPDYRMNSIRHLDLRADGLVAFAMQWQGDRSAALPLLGLHRRGETARIAQVDEVEARAMNGYGGSVAFWDQGRQLAVSSPRGNRVQFADVETLRITGARQIEDVCGLGVVDGRLLASSGTGVFVEAAKGAPLSQNAIAWDNHLVAVNRA